MSNQLDFFNEVQAEAESGFAPSNYRIVGKMTFNTGYKVYASGMSNEETFFPFTDKPSKAAAKAAAIDLNKKVGSKPDRVPEIVYAFVVFKDDLLAGASGWNVDQYFTRSKWQETVGEEEINGVKVQYDDRIVYLSVLHFLQSGKVKLGEPFWGSLKNTASPWHVRREEKTEKWTNNAGEPVVSYKTYKTLDEVYADKAEAQKAASSIPQRGADEVEDESYPGKFDPNTQWKPDDWESTGKAIIKDKMGSMPVPMIAKEVDAPIEAVKLAMAQIEARG